MTYNNESVPPTPEMLASGGLREPDLVDSYENPSLEDEVPLEVVEMGGQEEATLSQEVTEASKKPNFLKKSWNFARNHKIVTAAGAISVASLAASPAGDTLDALPLAGGSYLAMEAAWCGGAAMMLATGGKAMLNPLRIITAFENILDKAQDSKLFKAGLAVNTTAAGLQVALPTWAVVDKMPPSSWGVLSILAVDLAATLVVRAAIVKRVYGKDKKQP